MGTMKCDRCKKSVEETTTSSCSIGGIEISDYLIISKERQNKLCYFDDQFFCLDCMRGSICADCDKVLTKDEKELLVKLRKI